MNNSKIINVRLMKKVLVLVLSFLSVTAFAQNITVKGIVKDGTGEPIIGGSVLVKGSSNGTVTDIDVNYTLSNVPVEGVLEFSYIGMKKQDVNVKGKTVINVVLQEDTQILDEVVVTALGLKREQKALGYAVTDHYTYRILKRMCRNPRKDFLPLQSRWSFRIRNRYHG